MATFAWGTPVSVKPIDFQEIQDEQLARELERKETQLYNKQIHEDFNFAKQLTPFDVKEPEKLVEVLENECESVAGCSHKIESQVSSSSVINSLNIPNEVTTADEVIACLMQAEFDLEYDEELKRIERAKNKDSKVSVSYSKFRIYPDDMLFKKSERHMDEVDFEREKNWDRFETNEKEISKIGRSGYKVDDSGVIKTKHDGDLVGRRNACKVMSLSSGIPSGDCAQFDMKLSNKVYNQLRNHSIQMQKKTNQALDRRENRQTSEMGLDECSRLILYKMINSRLLENVDGIISTGKEAVILHADTDQSNEEYENLPKEVAIKVFSTTLNEFKQRDRYIKDDYRFKDKFSKQNNRTVINLWAEKEKHNLTRLKKCGILCPDVIVQKKHILVLSFIGENTRPAPKLKEARLSDAELIVAYEEIVGIMKKMYKEARLVHADLSEYNILWHENKCWIIDMAQSVEPIHPSALEFLMRDCGNITNFFEKRGVTVRTKEELFFEITTLDPLTSNATMLERIHMKGQPAHIANRTLNHDENTTLPEIFKPLPFPFDYAWKKVEELKEKTKEDNLNNEDIFEIKSIENDEWQEVRKTKKNHKGKSPNTSISENKTIIDNSIETLKELSVTLK
ncbi:unnamed protein product [Diamesa serratosioi]